MDTAALTNEQLVGTLAEVIDEVLDRCREYDSGDGDALEGFTFVTKAWNVALFGSGRRRSIGCYRYSLEQRAASRPLSDSSRDFSAFLSEHPELTGSDEEAPEPLDLSDDEAVLAALVEATAESRASFVESGRHEAEWIADYYPSAHQVAHILVRAQRGQDGTVSASDRMRTVAALKRLEQAGGVEAIRREVYGQRIANDYRVREEGSDA